ncbi:MAG: hypothetical protein IJQ28_07920 [Clostridia bacterium]|nr:hypothetical protein [Clostridia bacterium]
MIKILMGEKGSGKTKSFIDMVNQSLNEEKGNVICIMKGDRHLFDLRSAVRLTDTNDFCIEDFHALYGFISGMVSRDYDITHIFIDSITKIAGNDYSQFDGFLCKLENLAGKYNIKFTITVSAPVSEATDEIKKHLAPLN